MGTQGGGFFFARTAGEAYFSNFLGPRENNAYFLRRFFKNVWFSLRNSYKSPDIERRPTVPFKWPLGGEPMGPPGGPGLPLTRRSPPFMKGP